MFSGRSQCRRELKRRGATEGTKKVMKVGSSSPMSRYCCWIDEIRLDRWRAGKAGGENCQQIETEENQQLQILLPQQQDEEQLVLQYALPSSVLLKEYL